LSQVTALPTGVASADSFAFDVVQPVRTSPAASANPANILEIPSIVHLIIYRSQAWPEEPFFIAATFAVLNG
jgi:hypothetical protein